MKEKRGIIAVCYRKNPQQRERQPLFDVEILLAKRKKPGDPDDKRWEAQCETRKVGESLLDTFERGLREEIGLTNFSSAILCELDGQKLRVTNYWTELGLKKVSMIGPLQRLETERKGIKLIGDCAMVELQSEFEPRLNKEVAEFKWISPTDLLSWIKRKPGDFSFSIGALEQGGESLRRKTDAIPFAWDLKPDKT